MTESSEKTYINTTVNKDLLKEFKKLAIDLERPINDILEEAMRGLLEKYKEQVKK